MAAFTLAAKGKSLADSSYKTEVENISKFLHFHRPAEQPPIINPSTLDIKPEDYVTTKFTKKYNKTKVSKVFCKNEYIIKLYFLCSWLKKSLRYTQMLRTCH